MIAHNLRSCHNVGSLLRTAEGLGISHVYLTGYTPYPRKSNDDRLPHLAVKIHKQIQKTALGAEGTVDWSFEPDVAKLVADLKSQGMTVAALEQTSISQPLPNYQPPESIALLVGREVEGVEPEVLDLCDLHLEIPMFGQKESFNVTQAAAMALFHLTFS